MYRGCYLSVVGMHSSLGWKGSSVATVPVPAQDLSLVPNSCVRPLTIAYSYSPRGPDGLFNTLQAGTSTHMLISTHRHINELEKKTNKWGVDVVVGCFLLYSLGDPPPNSQVNHTRRLILPYKCPSLAFLNLNYTIFFLWDFAFFFFCIIFLLLGVLLGDWPLKSSSFCSSILFSLFYFYLFSVPAKCPSHSFSYLAVGCSALLALSGVLDSRSKRSSWG